MRDEDDALIRGASEDPPHDEGDETLLGSKQGGSVGVTNHYAERARILRRRRLAERSGSAVRNPRRAFYNMKPIAASSLLSLATQHVKLP